jgi:hypothetical protein
VVPLVAPEDNHREEIGLENRLFNFEWLSLVGQSAISPFKNFRVRDRPSAKFCSFPQKKESNDD